MIHAHNFPSNIAAHFVNRRSRTPFLWQCNEPSRIIYDPVEKANFFATMSRRPLGTRVLGRGVHLAQRFTSRPYDYIAAKAASTITVLSNYTAGWVRSLYERESVVIPPGVDGRIFHPRPGEKIRVRHGCVDVPTLLTISRLWPAKNLQTALLAFRQLLKRLPEARYLIVGDGPDREELVSLANRLAISPNVTFLEDPPPTDLPDYYSAADLFILPAIGEPWGLSALESMACGTPVIVSNQGGFPEFVEHGVTGMLVNPLNPEEMSNVTVDLLSDSARLKKMGLAAANAARLFNWERMTSAYIRLYERVIGSRES